MTMMQRRGTTALAAVTALICTLSAHAEVSPYSIGVSETLTRETNLARRPEGQPPIGDTIAATTLLAGFDRGIGRQHVYFNGSVRRNVYRENPIYDYTGYQVSSGLDWSTVNRISGTLNAAANRSLAQFGATGLFALERNVLTTRQLNAAGRVGTVTPLTFEGTFSHQDISYSAARFKPAEFSQNSVGANLLWRTSAKLSSGVGLRYTRGEYPQGAFGPDHFRGSSIDLSLDWQPSGASSVTARAGYSHIRHDDVSQRDFSGLTANLQWTWMPTGKWRLTSQYNRSTGEDATFVAVLGSSPGATNNTSRVTDVLALNATYLATAKVTFEGNVNRLHRNLSQTFTSGTGVATGSGGADSLLTLGLTARYFATRTLQFSCNAGRERRTTSTTLSYAYTASYASCTAQLTLQP